MALRSPTSLAHWSPVYLAYASRAGHAMLDWELYLPRSWADDPDRRAAAGVPVAAASHRWAPVRPHHRVCGASGCRAGQPAQLPPYPGPHIGPAHPRRTPRCGSRRHARGCTSLRSEPPRGLVRRRARDHRDRPGPHPRRPDPRDRTGDRGHRGRRRGLLLRR
ncbi:transposase [Pseudonocardia yuanmonensis]|uniref:transposase n=1 Tax=Pseudonocardia yuanmonensis TaxID=1095914 RepID=UPI003CD0BA5B